MLPTYKMHCHIGNPIEFHGLKGQYIFYAGICVVVNMIIFSLLYILGVNNYVCLFVCLGMGLGGIMTCHHLSHRYGPHGWRKRRQAKSMPLTMRPKGRKVYLQLKK